MNSVNISVEKAIFLIEKKEFNSKYKIDFKNKKIDALDAILLGKNGIDVPENLIEYDDDKIDYSDIPEITYKDIEEGKIKWTMNVELNLYNDIRDWIKRENINLNELWLN